MTDPTTIGALLALLMLTGAFAGLIAGLLGVGGGIVLVPAYLFIFAALGFHGEKLMQVCVATSLATIIVTSLRSLFAHHRKGAVDWDILRGWMPFIAAGALCGVVVAASLKSVTLQAIFGGIGVFLGLYMAFGRDNWRLGSAMPKGGTRAGAGAGIGFFSALMGIGGGIFGVPLMTAFGVAIHRAVATAAGFGVTIAVPSVLGYLLLDIPDAPPFSIGAVNLPAFAVTIAMTLITAPMGAKLAHRLNPRPLKLAFAGFVTLVALNMLWKALAQL